MNIPDFNLIDFKQADWVVKQGNFSTWKVGNIYWHGPLRFGHKKKRASIFLSNISQVPRKKIWYLVGLRQHLWRRYNKIKGFIPFIGIDILSLEVTFVLYQDRPVMPNLEAVVSSFLKSSAHRNLRNSVRN